MFHKIIVLYWMCTQCNCIRPEYPEEEMEEENIVEDDSELTLNKVEDNIFGVGH